MEDQVTLPPTDFSAKTRCHNTPPRSNYGRSREHRVCQVGPGLITVAGGKFTTYRTMAKEVTHLLTLLLRRPTLAKRITPELPVIKAQIIHSIRHEMALTLEDVLSRRTPMMSCAADQGLGVAEVVASWMAVELGWSIEERAAQVASYRHRVAMSRCWRDGGNQVC